MDDPVRDIGFEDSLGRARRLPYRFYDGVKELILLPVASAILSNRSDWQLDKLFGLPEFGKEITFPEWSRNGVERPVFSYPSQKDDGNFAVNLFKPHNAGVKEVLAHLLKNVPDIASPMNFFIGFVMLADKAVAFDAARYFESMGYESAMQSALRQCFGGGYDSEGDAIAYGFNREQDEGIRWHVLKVDDERIRLLAEQPQGRMPYTGDPECASWNGSELRRWLNEDFARRSAI